jgi:alpha-tubulin suppressor-like RCC1 family protein
VLGTNATTGDSTPTRVASGLTFSHISAGASHTCAIAADSTAYCWGQNSQGQLGDSTVAADSAPVAVVGPPRGYLFISVGDNHTCALDRTRAAYCWGSNAHGQIGNGAIGGVFVYPVPVSGGLT